MEKEGARAYDCPPSLPLRTHLYIALHKYHRTVNVITRYSVWTTDVATP